MNKTDRIIRDAIELAEKELLKAALSAGYSETDALRIALDLKESIALVIVRALSEGARAYTTLQSAGKVQPSLN